MIQEIIFCIFVLITVCGALGAVTFPKVFHNALSLGLSFFGIAGLYVYLNAEFLAAVQIIVYIGAIAIVIVFAIMLSDPEQKPHKSEKFRVFGAICASCCIFLVLVSAILNNGFYLEQVNETVTTTSDLGKALINQFILPFELISLVLLIAIIGALIISRKAADS